jgi:CRISPR system Cascade subunit CasA
MTFSFNLLDEAWIPCITQAGEYTELGLQDVLSRAHELREIASDSPLVTASVHRLALAVLHRVFGPANRAEWEVLWQQKRWEQQRLRMYFSNWHGRFDLFDSKYPIFQDPAMNRNPETITCLASGMGLGAFAALFNHHTEDTDLWLIAPEVARVLLSTQMFGLAGLKDPQKGITFTDAACCRVVNFFAQGDTLFETLALNLMREPFKNENPWRLNHAPEQDLPAWEMDNPFLEDTARPYGYLDYLTFYNRRVLLVPEEYEGRMQVRSMQYYPGLRLPAEGLNPLAHYFASKQEGYRPLRFNPERSLWRDSVALYEHNQNGGGIRPGVLDWLADLVQDGKLPAGESRRLAAFGMATEPGKAKVYFLRQEILPLTLEYLVDVDLSRRLRESETLAEDVSHQVYGALQTLAKMILEPEKDPEMHGKNIPEVAGLITRWNSEGRYWGELELPFVRLMNDLPQESESASTTWVKAIQTAAWAALQQAELTLGDTPRYLKAAISARRQLAAGLRKTLYPKKSQGD